jgi:ssDNA-binding replication factor A large subunit
MKSLKKRKKQRPETVKIGHAEVKIYPHRKKIKGRKEPYVTWQVADLTGEERKFRTFADHAAAMREAERIAGLISVGQANAATLTNGEAESYGRAVELLRPTGDALLTAVERYVEATKLLGGGSRLGD